MNIADSLHSLFERAPVDIAHSDRETLRVTGRDSARWLQALVTADVLAMPMGAQCYSLLLEKKGRVVADLYIQRTAEGYDVSVSREVFEQVFEAFERHIIMEDVELQRVDLGAFVETFDPVEGKYPHGRAKAHFSWSENVGSYLDARSAEGRGVRALLGVPAFGVEFDARDYPQEAGLSAPEVSMSKGCYLGQEVVCMIQMRGSVSRALHLVTATDEVTVGDLRLGDTQVGVMRGAGKFGPYQMGFAMLKRTASEPGTTLCDALGNTCTVVI